MCLFLLLSCCPWHPPASAGDENKPPQITGVKFTRWPELVGEPVVGYVNASDPEGGEVTVIAVFRLVGEWARGVPEAERVHNVTARPAPEHGPHCFEIVANTSGWLPGTYQVLIVAIDSEGAYTVHSHEGGLLALRLEISPPPQTRVWAVAGLGLLSCLLAVMFMGFVKALRAKRPEKKWLWSFYPEIY